MSEKKDLCASLLATQLRADGLLILTEADGVYEDYGKPHARLMKKPTVEDRRTASSLSGSGFRACLLGFEPVFRVFSLSSGF